MRRTCAISAVILLAVGCSTATDTSTTPSKTAAAPAALAPAEAITWARGIDPCALIDRQTFESFGTVSAIGTSSNSTSCEARVDDGTERGIAVSWSIALAPNDFLTSTLGTIVDIDGVKARRTDAASTLAPEVRDQLVESACNYDIAFENGIAVRMRVSMERDRNACATGESLVRAVISEWPEHPEQGSSPNTTVTVLTDASPCAVVPTLQQPREVVFDWKGQSLTSCSFTVDGTEVLVSFDYRARELVTTGANPATFGDHAGYSEVFQGTTFARATVGEEFDGVEAGRQSRLVPVVEVNGEDTAVVFDVMASVLNQIPA
ncbi:DUF3558 family protein [Mycolicibacterium sp. XJ870]